MISEIILAAGIDGLAYWEHGGTIDDFLDYELSPEQISSRRTISSAIFSYFRYKKSIDQAITNYTKTKIQPYVRRLLCIATVQICIQTGIEPSIACDIAVGLAKRKKDKKVAGFVNAVLRKIAENRLNNLFTEQELPDLLISRWKIMFGENEYRTLIDSLNYKNEITFRLRNKNKIELVNSFASKIENEKLNVFDFYKTNEQEALFSSGLLNDGSVYIQDIATSLSIKLVLKNVYNVKTVLDLCAAPGGKTLMLSDAFNNISLTATDKSEFRLNRLKDNVAIYKTKNITVVSPDKINNLLLTSKYDLVFLDVPCSNSGVYRKRPDAVWKFSESNLKEITELQLAILQKSKVAAASKGYILYSTCSIDSDENKNLIAKFVTMNPEFKIVEDELLLPSVNHDGAYAALLQKI